MAKIQKILFGNWSRNGLAYVEWILNAYDFVEFESDTFRLSVQQFSVSCKIARMLFDEILSLERLGMQWTDDLRFEIERFVEFKKTQEQLGLPLTIPR